jgi:hypothetical protein
LLASKSHPIPELIIFKLNDDGVFSLSESLTCEETIFSISASICGKVAAVQLTDGSVLKCRVDVDDDSAELLPWMSSDENAVQFPSVCVQVKVAFSPTAETNNHRLFAISARNRLYCDEVEIASGIRYQHESPHFKI